jgi:transposase
MAIVGGFDVHRSQLTFDYVDTDTGEVRVGQVRPATRVALNTWLRRLPSQGGDLAVEGCTGWRFVAEEVSTAGYRIHVAEPAETAALRGPKKRAKTDRADARHLRDLLLADRLPESWIPPAHVLEVRVIGRLYAALMSDRQAWCQRIHAQLFHQGASSCDPLTDTGRKQLAETVLSQAGRQLVDTALAVIDDLDGKINPLREQLRGFTPRQPGCRALVSLFGVGTLLAPIIWSEMGDTRRFSSSDQAVRHTGLDVTVWSSDSKRSPGHLSRQGPPALRWALFEAAYHAARRTSPDHDYYEQVRQRQGSERAALSVARKLARRTHHILANLGDQAWVEAA